MTGVVGKEIGDGIELNAALHCDKRNRIEKELEKKLAPH